jgi:NAD(P)-dependent dehydrogenase (short-subunit alcohol dehydrogenase family)
LWTTVYDEVDVVRNFMNDKDSLAYDGKVVFVAGGSSVLNLGIAKEFADRGARIALMSRNEERIRASAESIDPTGERAIGLVGDVRDYDSVEAAFARTHEVLGAVDVVISGAAGNFLASALGMSANAFKSVIDIDLLGTFNVLRASFAHLNRPGASLIVVSSPQGQRSAMFQSHACAAKAGINMLIQCLAMEWGPAGVRVNGISPGPVKGTEGMARLTPTAEDEELFSSKLALRDYCLPEDAADVTMFLASEQARYITGTIVDVDGGARLGDASADAVTVLPRGSANATFRI